MLQDLYEKTYHLYQGQMRRTDPVFASQFIDTDELLSIFAQNENWHNFKAFLYESSLSRQ